MLDPTPNLRKLADAELMRVELEARSLMRRTLFIGIALLIGAITLVMLSLGGFFALSKEFGPDIAAFIMAAVLGILCLLALYVALKGPSRERQLEMQLVEQNISTARDHVKNDVTRIEREIDKLSMGLLGLVKGGTSGGMPALTLLLGILAALSPVLRRYLAPFLKGGD
ncbi:MAG: hypothetical protein GC184_03705 [Rhizobiales bacterium]|nr:hypothetical protein [Hyphomicrobiales bacterium]